MAVDTSSVSRVSLIFAVFLTAAPAQAANTLWITTAGTSTAQGTITIESFSKPILPGGAGSLSPQAMETAHVTVPAGSSAVNTAIMIRDSIDAQMSANYVPTINPSCSYQVVVDYVGAGTATLNILDNVPGQKIAEVPGPCISTIPTLTEWGIVMAVLIMAGLGVMVMAGRRRSPPAGT